MTTQLYAVRGAIDVEANTAKAIQDGIITLTHEIIKQNKIQAHQVLSLFLTVTPDLTALNPAAALRLDTHFDWQNIPLLCSQEPILDKQLLPHCIRLLIQWQSAETLSTKPVYLGNAQKLRPDLVTNGSHDN